MRFALALLVFALPLAAAPVPKAKQSTEQKLIGKWRMVRSDDDGGEPKGYQFYVTFQEKGEFELRRVYGGDTKDTVWTGSFKVIDDDKIDYSVTINGSVKTEVLTIDKLTGSEVSWTDPAGLKESLERAKEK